MRNARRWKMDHDDRGAVLILASVFAAVAVLAAALAVDIGRQAATKRDDQRVADMVALDAVRGFAIAPTNPRPAIEGLAASSATRNGYQPNDTANGHSMQVELLQVLLSDGGYTMIPIPDTGQPSIDATGNAVRITLTSTTDNLFAGGQKALKAIAVATLDSQLVIPPGGAPTSAGGTTRIGSTLASLDTSQTTILNDVMTQLVGGVVNVNAVGWQGIANGYVTLSSLQSALGMAAASPSEFLNSQFTYPELVTATVSALKADGTTSTASIMTALGTIYSATDPAFTGAVQLPRLFKIGGDIGNGADVANMKLSVRHLVQGGAIAADNDHFLSFNLAAADLPLIPNIQSATVKVGLIEAPQTAIGPYGKDSLGGYYTTAQTSQVRILVDTVIGVPLGGLLGIKPVHIPYYLSGGDGTASLDTAHCTAPTPESVDILGVTNAVGADVATVSNTDLSSTTSGTVAMGEAVLLDVAGVITVTAKAGIGNVVGGASQLLSFTPDYAAKQADAQHITGSALSLPTVTSGDMQTQLLAGGAALNVASIQQSIASGIAAAIPGIQDEILAGVSKALGLTFGGADVWAPPDQMCATTWVPADPVTTLVSIPQLIQ